METVNIYAADATDFDSEGLCALTPTSCEFEESANGDSLITLVHPYDDEGRWALIAEERILKCDVPVRTVPELENGARVTTAEVWKVSATASRTDRRLYYREEGDSYIRLIDAGAEVTVVKAGEKRHKIKVSRYTGWMNLTGLESKIQDVDISTDAKLEAAVPSVKCKPQLFRIKNVKREETEITCEAGHITQDLLGVLCDVQADAGITGVEWCRQVQEESYTAHGFTIATDIGDTRTGADLVAQNGIFCLLDDTDGFVGRFGGEVIRDNFQITILRAAGIDRGFSIEYGKNLTGVSCETSYENVITSLVPVGTDEEGGPLYLTGHRWRNAPNHARYAIERMARLDVDDAQVSQDDGVTVALARERMLAAVQAQWDAGANQPEMTIKVEFVLLGDTEEYARFRDLEVCCLYDLVHVHHPQVAANVTMKVSRIKWDVNARRMLECELGTASATMASAISTVSAGTNTGSHVNVATEIADKSVTLAKLAADAKLLMQYVAGDTLVIGVRDLLTGAVTGANAVTVMVPLAITAMNAERATVPGTAVSVTMYTSTVITDATAGTTLTAPVTFTATLTAAIAMSANALRLTLTTNTDLTAYVGTSASVTFGSAVTITFG